MEHLYLAIGRSLLRACFLDLSRKGIKYFWPRRRDDAAHGSHWNREKSLRSNEKYPLALYIYINWVKGRNGWRLEKNDNKYWTLSNDDTSHLSCFNRFNGYLYNMEIIYIKKKKERKNTFFRHFISSDIRSNQRYLCIHALKDFWMIWIR